MVNRLAEASSPYLLQHQDNPVDWYEWGPDAFAAARLRDVPVMLSVGYSACHWCHVMAHESFEDEDTARYMNAHFVNVKVDREERPDVDRIYMEAVQAMSGHGGWPMTCFLTPAGEPFFAGTYFPREPRGNHPSFMQVLNQVNEAWKHRREILVDQATRLTEAVRGGLPPSPVTTGMTVVRAGVDALASGYDWEHGGFGGAPKFPQAPNLELLLRVAALSTQPATNARTMLENALEHMAAGGIHDHLGGGFARYAVDRQWLVPHFEKMLYDNALLARIYLRAWQVTGDVAHLGTARSTLNYLQKDMVDPAGGLHSAEDADSEGVEGKFYTWTWDELAEVTGRDARTAAAIYGVTDRGNFEGTNVLHRPVPLPAIAAEVGVTIDELAEARERIDAALLARRSERIRPGRDDKVVAAWNGFALRAFAEAGRVLDHEPYTRTATGIAKFALEELTVDGRVQRSWRQGKVSGPGFCDDYAALAIGYLTLYQATGETTWYEEGERLCREMLRLFADPDGGFFATGTDAEPLITRPKNLMDNPTPSDNALAAEAMLMLAAYTGEFELGDVVAGVYRSAGRLVEQYPGAVGHLLAVMATEAAPVKEVAVVGPAQSRKPLEDVVWEVFRPDCVLASGAVGTGSVPLLEGRSAGDGKATAHVCRNFVCELPVSTATDLRAQLAIGAE